MKYSIDSVACQLCVCVCVGEHAEDQGDVEQCGVRRSESGCQNREEKTRAGEKPEALTDTTERSVRHTHTQ